MKKEYIAPALMQYEYKSLPLMISVDKGGAPVTDPSQVQSHKFWGNSIFEDDEEVDIDY